MPPLRPSKAEQSSTDTQPRYVGILHEINSENSTVALENVTSFGTEGRKNDPDQEVPGSDSIYEYIVFRGGDVKDLRIEEPPKENKPPPPPQVPNDPAILGVSLSSFIEHLPAVVMKRIGCILSICPSLAHKPHVDTSLPSY